MRPFRALSVVFAAVVGWPQAEALAAAKAERKALGKVDKGSELAPLARALDRSAREMGTAQAALAKKDLARATEASARAIEKIVKELEHQAVRRLGHVL